ncbi:hypothetical protein, partial [uncultured Clostridium sp.]|uniref:hypothetical protein n=1 Tax=uncultured Clostridium sp. TaxID=59620 RepID=UPI0026145E7F
MSPISTTLYFLSRDVLAGISAFFGSFWLPPKKQTLLWREEGMCQTFSIFSVISVERRPFH